jgi:hypothetical protein
MNNQFDELTKSLAQAVTRRAALQHFGRGLAGILLAAFGLSNRAEAAPQWCDPLVNYCCCKGCNTHLPRQNPNYMSCVDICRLPLGCK